jgi:Putative Zn-dependent protease, contains TPR repeats
LALALLAARSNPQAAGAAIASTQALAVQNQLNYTREYEREADRVGFETMSKAGFDPHGMASFFTRLQRANRLSDNNAPAYLRTHPLTSQRIADMDARADAAPYVQVPDSLDFQLVRARLRAADGTPQEAVALFKAELRDKRYSQASVEHYGLALALLRARHYPAAEAEIQRLQAMPNTRSPMIADLAARSAADAGQYATALARYRAAMTSYPGYRPLLYGYADALFKAGKVSDSAAFTENQLQQWPDDRRLWRLSAQAFAQLGQQLQSHRALAEALALSGNLKGAIEQVDIGLKAGDGGFYEKSAAEARRREWMQLDKSQNKSRS